MASCCSSSSAAETSGLQQGVSASAAKYSTEPDGESSDGQYAFCSLDRRIGVVLASGASKIPTLAGPAMLVPTD